MWEIWRNYSKRRKRFQSTCLQVELEMWITNVFNNFDLQWDIPSLSSNTNSFHLPYSRFLENSEIKVSRKTRVRSFTGLLSYPYYFYCYFSKIATFKCPEIWPLQIKIRYYTAWIYQFFLYFAELYTLQIKAIVDPLFIRAKYYRGFPTVPKIT